MATPISHSGQHNDIIAGLQAVGFNVVDYGAVGNGVTDDYASITAAITAATPTKGTVVFPPSANEYMTSAGIVIPDGVSVQSYGGPVTLKASQAMSWLVQIDYTLSIVGNRKGRIIGLVLDGNNLASIGWYIGSAVQRYWERCDAINCATVGWLLNGTQNCVFVSCDTEDNGSALTANGGGMRLNHGAGNNVFIRCEFNRNRDHQLVICQNDSIDAPVSFPAGTFPTPSHNHWFGCVFERVQTQTTSQIYMRAAKDNQWHGCSFSTTGARNLVHAESLDGDVSLNRFVGSNFSGDASSTLFRAEDAYRTYFWGCFAETFNTLYALSDSSPVIDHDDFHTGGVTNYFTALGVLQRDQLVISGIGQTHIVAGRGLHFGISATAAAIASNGQIVLGGVGIARVAPAADVTGITMETGFVSGQMFQVVNESSHSITFAAAGTSNVATGTSCIIAALRAATFTWDSSTARWYQS